MKDYIKFKKHLLKNKEVKKTFEALGSEFAFVEMIIRKRLKQGLTQKDLARKIGTKQAAISRLESGKSNPTVSFLRHVAKALDNDLKISLK